MSLRVRDLTIATAAGTRLVDGVDLDIAPGQWFALIGESGSGKSLTAMSLANLLPAALQRSADTLTLGSHDLLTASGSALRRLRGSALAYVFQDYAGSFTPYRRLGAQMVETLRSHERIDLAAARRRVTESLDEVGLPGAQFARRYPLQCSGGQVQRVALATAMLLRPTLLVADEPTTALDAVTQARMLDLIDTLRTRHGCAVLFITHDLRCVKRHADRVAVMRHGRLVESGATAQVVAHPSHDYTRRLFDAVPRISVAPPDDRPAPEPAPAGGSIQEAAS